MPATLPTKTAADLGEVLANTKAPKTNQLSAVNVEKIKDWIIAFGLELGLTDGSTDGSVWKVLASALLDSDFAGAALGRLTRTGAGTYGVVKDNLSAAGPPSGTDDSTAGYEPGSIWIVPGPAGLGGIAICQDATPFEATWLFIPATAGDLSYDPTGRTYAVGATVQAAIDAIDAALVGLTAAEVGFDPADCTVTLATDVQNAIVDHDVAISSKAQVSNGIVAVGAANNDGASTFAARVDHVHAHGDQAGGTLHSLAGGGTAGFALYGVRTLSASGNILATDRLLFIDGSANLTIDGTLPDPATVPVGVAIRLKKIAGRARVRLVPHAGEKIEGVAATYVIPDSSPLIDGDWWVATDGTDWRVGGSDKDIHLDRKNRIVIWRDDFGNNTVAQWLTELSGSGAAVALMSAASACPGGSLNLITGSTATGIAGLRSAINLFYSTRFDFLEMCSVASLSNLDDGVDTFHVDMCAAGGPSFAAGWAIRYDQSISANWRLVRFAGGVVAAAVDTGVAATAGLLNQQHRFRTVYDRVNDKIDAYIDGASVASLNGFGAMSALYLYPTRIEKTASVNSRGVNLDYTYAVAVPASTAAYRA